MITNSPAKSQGLKLQDTFKLVSESAYQKKVLQYAFRQIWYPIESWLTDCKTKQILDLSSGFGFFAESLLNQNWEVICADENMYGLTKIQKRLSRFEPSVAFELYKDSALPFEDQVFETVLSIFSLEFATDPVDLLLEMTRVIHPGGRLICCMINPYSFWRFASMQLIAKPKGIDMKYQFIDIKKLIKNLTKMGFAIKATSTRAKSMPIFFKDQIIPAPMPGFFMLMASKK